MYRLIITFLFLSVYAGAQTADSTGIDVRPDLFEELLQVNENGGRVTFKGETGVNDLVRLHMRMNEARKTVNGYRIQIFSGNSLDYSIEQLQQMKADFENDFPDIPVYLNYFDPDFKIRAGNFRNRLDCIPTLKKIRRKHPSSYPVKTEIPLNDLLRAAHPESQPTETPEEKSMF